MAQRQHDNHDAIDPHELRWIIDRFDVRTVALRQSARAAFSEQLADFRVAIERHGYLVYTREGRVRGLQSDPEAGSLQRR